MMLDIFEILRPFKLNHVNLIAGDCFQHRNHIHTDGWFGGQIHSEDWLFEWIAREGMISRRERTRTAKLCNGLHTKGMFCAVVANRCVTLRTDCARAVDFAHRAFTDDRFWIRIVQGGRIAWMDCARKPFFCE